MHNQKIEDAVTYLHREIYRAQRSLFKAGAHPLTMLRPEIAAQVLDLDYIVLDRIETDQYGMEAAGLLDLPGQAMYISQKFRYTTQRFTASHECGHALLHPELASEGLFHRDLPNPEMHTYRRPQREQDADYFAACFLIPWRTLIQEFEARFGKPPLRLNHQSSFYLGGKSDSDLHIEPSGGLRFPMAVASAQKFGGYPFKSLADQFMVSPRAMAIRLRELELVRD
jgi:hypothetical protein